jgi:anthranilate synthase component I
MKPPFDIAADLDTPVSAYLKLAPFKPRFLLESVEGGERLARYSFIGFGDCLEVRLDSQGLIVGGLHLPRPRSKAQFLDALRDALTRAPQPLPEIPGVPLLGGLVGYTRCATSNICQDVVWTRPRRHMRTTSRRARCWCLIT